MFPILHLTLKKEWFDLIKSGEKKTEYREIKPYWYSRLCYVHDGEYFFREFDKIIFSLGYHKDCPKLEVDFRGIHYGTFKGRSCFAIELGKVKILETSPASKDIQNKTQDGTLANADGG